MRLALAALLLMSSSCVAARSPNDLAFSSAGSGRTVRLDEGRAHGPDTDVQRFDDELRGVWRGARINARLAGDRVTGVLDSRPLDLHVEERDGALEARGLVGGTTEDIELTDRVLRARIGGCGYDLKRTDESTYRGYRCGSVPATVKLPEKWSALPLSERATYLALMLTL